MAKFRKKPVVIEAMRWDGGNQREIEDWMGRVLVPTTAEELVIPTLEDGKQGQAQHVASLGDWIIRGVAGEFYPCKPDIFAATYEPVLDW